MDKSDITYDTRSGTDFRELFLKERQRVLDLQNELEIQKYQASTYARELSNVYQHTKMKRKQLAQTNLQLVKYASDLRTTITNLKQANSAIQDAYRDTIHRLVLASEYKDKETGNHITRMSRYSSLLASKLGFSNQDVEAIGYAAPMHDVGKIGIPDSIILKNGMLTEGEFRIIKTHTTIGAVILEHSRASVLQTARIIALSHHERWDGTGYPNGLSKDQIPLSARIVSLSDAFDALTSRRPYKSPYPVEVACKIISYEREHHFDPKIVDVFLTNINEFVAIKREIDNEEPLQGDGRYSLSERDRNSSGSHFKYIGC